MSGCSIHHFKTIDRPFTNEERAEIDSWSSRFSPTSTEVRYVYHYGSFKKSVNDVFPKYFDAMLHFDNWENKQLMFRFPKALVDIEVLNQFSHKNKWEYCYLQFKEVDEYVIMDLKYSVEEGGDWIMEDQYELGALLPLREEILNGDYRSLYLGWLMVQQDGTEWEDEEFEDEDYDETTMPPIPANLQALTLAQKSLMDTFWIDEGLVEAAATVSPDARQQTMDYKKLISLLSEEEKETYLLQFVVEQPGIRMQLRQRLETLGGDKKSLAFGTSPSWVDLVQIATQKDKERAARNEIERQKEEELARLARIEELKAMIPKKETMWQKATEHLKDTYASAYDAATNIISDLKEVAEYEGKLAEFEQQLDVFVRDYTRRPAFIRRLRDKDILKIKG